MTTVPATEPTTAAPAADVADDLPEQLRIRREKRARLIESGHGAFPVWVERTHTLAEIRDQWGHLSAGEETEALVRTAGRVMYILSLIHI